MLSTGLQTLLTKRTFIHSSKIFKPIIVGASWNWKENNTKNECIVKKAFFSQNVNGEYNVINARLRITTKPTSVTIEKWPVFLQNASGNPAPNSNWFLYKFDCLPVSVIATEKPISIFGFVQRTYLGFR